MQHECWCGDTHPDAEFEEEMEAVPFVVRVTSDKGAVVVEETVEEVREAFDKGVQGVTARPAVAVELEATRLQEWDDPKADCCD